MELESLSNKLQLIDCMFLFQISRQFPYQPQSVAHMGVCGILNGPQIEKVRWFKADLLWSELYRVVVRWFNQIRNHIISPNTPNKPVSST